MAFYEGNYGPVDPGVIGCEFSWRFVPANLQMLTTCTKLRPMRISARELHLPVKSASCDYFVRDLNPVHIGEVWEASAFTAAPSGLPSQVKFLISRICSVQQTVVLRIIFKGCQCYVLLFLKLAFLIHMQEAEAIHLQTLKKIKMIRGDRNSLVSRDSVIWLMLILIRGEMTDLGMSRPRNEQRCEKRKEARCRQKA